MLARFFAAVPGSIKGQINLAELTRAVLAAGGASTLVGLALALIAVISADAAKIFPSPGLAMAATFGLAQLADLLRRMDHGQASLGTITADGVVFAPKTSADPVASIYRGTPVEAAPSLKPAFQTLPR